MRLISPEIHLQHAGICVRSCIKPMIQASLKPLTHGTIKFHSATFLPEARYLDDNIRYRDLRIGVFLYRVVIGSVRRRHSYVRVSEVRG